MTVGDCGNCGQKDVPIFHVLKMNVCISCVGEAEFQCGSAIRENAKREEKENGS